MKNLSRTGGLVCALGLLAWAAGYAPRTAFADEPAACPALKALEGTWTTSETDSLDARWVFKGDLLEVTVNGQEYKGKVKVNDKAKPHATLDVALTEGPEESKGKTGRGIYKLDGKKLVVSVSQPGHDRPKDFEPVPDEVYVFELMKKKG
ncbi:MAG: TIGR03067 domain-containing protein [Isosphaeraceae bacterium]